MKFLLTIFWLLPPLILAQNPSFDRTLFDGFEQYKERSLTQRRFRHKDIQPLIEIVGGSKGIEVTKVGESIEGRSISLISMGQGDIDILLWSQMHGDEPTATMAIFDILNFLTDKNEYKKEQKELLRKVKIHFLPMLNPDGAEKFQRRNALDIDLNRDALRLQSPEARILKSVRDSLDADFGFNLHDQSRYYNAERTQKPATISYLAPAYNYEKDINGVRGNAMKIIVYMNQIIQKYAEGQVGRYSDDFEPRAFGDNIQKWGTSTILIESGGQFNDPEKQFIRKLNYMSILSAIFIIADGSYQDIAIDDYEKIPENDRKLFDLKIENLTYNLAGNDYVLDLGIMRDQINNETNDSYHYFGRIDEIGDLSTYYGYQTLDASGLQYQNSKSYSQNVPNYQALDQFDFKAILKAGYTNIQLDSIPATIKFSKYPINISQTDSQEEDELKIGRNATFLLMNGDELRYVVLNGYVYDPSVEELSIKNGVIR